MSPGLLGPTAGVPGGGEPLEEQQGGRWAPVRKMSRRTTGDPAGPGWGAPARGSAHAGAGGGPGAPGVPGVGSRGAARRPVADSGRPWDDVADATSSSGPLLGAALGKSVEAAEGGADWAGAWPQHIGLSGPLAVPSRPAAEASPQGQGHGQGHGQYDPNSDLERQRSFRQSTAQVPIMRSQTDGELRLRGRRGGCTGAANENKRSPMEAAPGASNRQALGAASSGLGPRVYPRNTEWLPQAGPSREGLVGHSTLGLGHTSLGWVDAPEPARFSETFAQQPSRGPEGGAPRALGLRVEVGEEEEEEEEGGAWVDDPRPMRMSESFARPIRRGLSQAPSKHLPAERRGPVGAPDEGEDEEWVDDPRPAQRSECFGPPPSKVATQRTLRGLREELSAQGDSNRWSPAEGAQPGPGQAHPGSHTTATQRTPGSGAVSGSVSVSGSGSGSGRGGSGRSSRASAASPGGGGAAAVLSSLVRQWTASKTAEGRVGKRSSPRPESGSGSGSGSGTPGAYSRAATLKSKSQREQGSRPGQQKEAQAEEEKEGEEGEEGNEEEWINDYRISHSAPFPSQRRRSSSRTRNLDKGNPPLAPAPQQVGKPGKGPHSRGGPCPTTPKKSPWLADTLLGALAFKGGRVVGAQRGRPGASKSQGSLSRGGNPNAGPAPRALQSHKSLGARELARALVPGSGETGVPAALRKQPKGEDPRAAPSPAGQGHEERGESVERRASGSKEPGQGREQGLAKSLAAELQELEAQEGRSPAGAMTRECPEPVLVLGVWTGVVAAANPAALRALGFADEDEARKCTLFELSEGLQQATWQELMNALMTGETGRTTLQVRLLKSQRSGHSGPLSGSWVLLDMHLSGSGLNAELVALISRLEAPPMLVSPFGSRRSAGAPEDAAARHSGRFSPGAVQKLAAAQDALEDPEPLVYPGPAWGSSGELAGTGAPEEGLGGADSEGGLVSPFGGMPQVYLSRSLEPERGAPVKLHTPERTLSGAPKMHRSQSHDAKEPPSPEAPDSMGAKSKTCPRNGARGEHQSVGSRTPTESSPGDSQGSTPGVPKRGLSASPSSREEEEAPMLVIPVSSRRAPNEVSHVSPKMPSRGKSLVSVGAPAMNRYRSLRRNTDNKSPKGQGGPSAQPQHHQKPLQQPSPPPPLPQQQQQSQQQRISLKMPQGDASFPLAAISPRLQAVVQETSFGVPFNDPPRHTTRSTSPRTPSQSQARRNPEPPSQPRKPAGSPSPPGASQAHANARRDGRQPAHHSGPQSGHQAGPQRAHHSGPVHVYSKGPLPVYHSGPLAGEGRSQQTGQGGQQGSREAVPVQRIRSFQDWHKGDAQPAAHLGPELGAGSGTPLAAPVGLPPSARKATAQGSAGGAQEAQKQGSRHAPQPPPGKRAHSGPMVAHRRTHKPLPSAASTGSTAGQSVQKSTSEAAGARRFGRWKDGAPLGNQVLEGEPWATASGRPEGDVEEEGEEGEGEGREGEEGEEEGGGRGRDKADTGLSRAQVLRPVLPFPPGRAAVRPVPAARPLPPALASVIDSLLPDSDTSMIPQHGSQDWTAEPRLLWHPRGVPGAQQGNQGSVDWSVDGGESSEDEEGAGGGKGRGAASGRLRNGKLLDTRAPAINASTLLAPPRDTGSSHESPGEDRTAEGTLSAHEIAALGTPEASSTSTYDPSIAATVGATPPSGTPPGHQRVGSEGNSLGSEEPWAGAYQPWPSDEPTPGQRTQGAAPVVPGDYQRIDHGRCSVESVEYEPSEAGSLCSEEDDAHCSTDAPTVHQEGPRRLPGHRTQNASATSGSSSDASHAFGIPMAHPVETDADTGLSPAAGSAPGNGIAPVPPLPAGAPEEDGESLESPHGVLWALPVEEGPPDAPAVARRTIPEIAPSLPYQSGRSGLPAAGDSAGAGTVYQRNAEFSRDQAGGAAPSSAILESWFSNLLTAAGFGFVLFDGRRRITLCSRHFAANLGFADSEDAVGTPLEDIMGPESLEDLETLLAQTQKASTKRLVSFKHRNRRTVSAMISAHPDYPLAHKEPGEVGALVEFL